MNFPGLNFSGNAQISQKSSIKGSARKAVSNNASTSGVSKSFKQTAVSGLLKSKPQKAASLKKSENLVADVFPKVLQKTKNFITAGFPKFVKGVVNVATNPSLIYVSVGKCLGLAPHPMASNIVPNTAEKVCESLNPNVKLKPSQKYPKKSLINKEYVKTFKKNAGKIAKKLRRSNPGVAHKKQQILTQKSLQRKIAEKALQIKRISGAATATSWFYTLNKVAQAGTPLLSPFETSQAAKLFNHSCDFIRKIGWGNTLKLAAEQSFKSLSKLAKFVK